MTQKFLRPWPWPNGRKVHHQQKRCYAKHLSRSGNKQASAKNQRNEALPSVLSVTRFDNMAPLSKDTRVVPVILTSLFTKKLPLFQVSNLDITPSSIHCSSADCYVQVKYAISLFYDIWKSALQAFCKDGLDKLNKFIRSYNYARVIPIYDNYHSSKSVGTKVFTKVTLSDPRFAILSKFPKWDKSRLSQFTCCHML